MLPQTAARTRAFLRPALTGPRIPHETLSKEERGGRVIDCAVIGPYVLVVEDVRVCVPARSPRLSP